MKLQAKVALAYLTGFISMQQSLCGGLLDSTGSGVNNWTCTCLSSYQGKQNNSLNPYCFTSCDCNPVEGASGATWTCKCGANGFPKIASDGQDTACFTGCNCTSGSVNEVHASRKRFTTKVDVIILLLCLVITTLVFLASVICFVHRKKKNCNQSPVSSPDKESSCDSATNLISYRSASVPETRVDICSRIKLVSGCFRNASFCGRKIGTIRGTIIQFSYSELEYATDKFSSSNLIGNGGSSSVYRGQLKDGRIVAVKRFKIHGGPDADSIFSTEVDLLSRLHHCHVVLLLGYCSEFQGTHAKRLLVFEYMANGSLRDCLDGMLGENMKWDTRVAIAIGAARGLEYLHEAAAPRILHRDVKSTNILLDEKWNAKITDLGMAKSLRADGASSCSSSPARMQGTFGYFAPEYAIVGKASLMSDVFSFGVVLLELITGRQPIHKSTNKGEQSLVTWATPRLQDRRRIITELPDPRLRGCFPKEEMEIMAYLAKECLLLDPDARPTMSELVQVLSTISRDKSRRRSLPLNLFQMAPAGVMTNLVEASSEAKQVRQAAQLVKSPRYSMPLDIDRVLCAGSKSKEVNTVSVERTERMLPMSLKYKSSSTLDTESVDLNEPRFESFRVANFKAP